MIRKTALVAMVVLVLLSMYAIATQPPAVHDAIDVLNIGDDPESWIRDSEADIHQQARIIPGAEKRIRWHDAGAKSRTGWGGRVFPRLFRVAPGNCTCP